MTDKERLLRDALSETTALITGLLHRGEHRAWDLLKVAGGNIEAKGLAALRQVNTDMSDDIEGPECCGCVNPTIPCPGCEYHAWCSISFNKSQNRAWFW